MNVRQALTRIRKVSIPARGVPVEETAAREILAAAPEAVLVRDAGRRGRPDKSLFRVAVADAAARRRLEARGSRPPRDREWLFFDLETDGSGTLLASSPNFLFAGACRLVEDLAGEPTTAVRRRIEPLTFAVEKSTFDLVLTQYARIIRGFDRERHMREYARLGFTQVEVNGLAAPFPFEPGVPGEFYPDFYTYCPGLDQFVSSRLNEGLYPREHLQANLNRLKENARLALKYGLTPGLLCFEPRSQPEEMFRRAPTLRGPRVDHPFRSFKPRYALTLVHPAARAHYAELMAGLMAEVPELEFLAVWSNDSGSGFEHTKSLYVGRNGGAYLVREWKNDEEIARLAAENVARFFAVLRDAAAEVNPNFRVITRLESFYGERAHLWPRLRDRIDAEANSLLTTGWENNYPHPSYKDIQVIGSLYHNTLRPAERRAASELEARGSRAYFYHYFASFGNFEPLLGIPFPWLTADKLKAAAGLGITHLAHMGGIHPPDKVPYAVNQEVFRAFQFDRRLDVDAAVRGIASRWVGPRRARRLVRGWRLLEAAIRRFVPMSLYSGFGTVWNRLIVRPFVPDIEAVPEAERAYYEQVMVSPIHNPNKVDLGKDVLFDLIPPAYAEKARRRMDRGVWAPLDRGVAELEAGLGEARRAGDARAAAVFQDQLDRAKALRCLYRTLHATAVWISAVHGYRGTRSARKKSAFRRDLRAMIDREIRNTRDWLALWEGSRTEWMLVSGTGETPFIYGEIFAGLLRRRIEIMRRHRGDEPRIDPDYMFRI